MNTKLKGNAGIGAAIAYYTSKNIIVSIPLTDSQDYDLVVDIDSTLYKVQVKFTSQKAKSGNYIVSLRSISGSSKESYKTVIDTLIDYLFIIADNNDKYIIPIIDIENINTLTITDEIIKKYKV